MNYSALVDSVSLVKDIYSFVVAIFMWLSTEIQRPFSGEYASFCKQKTKILREIRALTDTIPEATNADFGVWKNEWVGFLEENQDDSRMICYQTLRNIDDLLPNLLKRTNRSLISHGPLNEYDQQDAFLYISAPKAFFDTYFEQNKIREGRQTVLHNATGLNRNFKHFFVVKKSSANDFIPTVKYYHTKVFSDSELRVGCSPYSSKPWFEEVPNPISDTFSIKYDPNSFSRYNKQITDLIELFDLYNVDIVTFPELALNDSSLKAIQQFLLRTELKHVKLVCTGSCWADQKNEAYILSRDGTVLLKYLKKKTYQRYSKEKQVYISEDIDSDPFVSFLDIPGVGRLSYNICYDYDNDDIETLCSSVMCSDFMFVAAYSNDTQLMMEKASANARLRGITTILTNACAVADAGQLISYIVEPQAENKHLLSKDTLLFKKEGICTANCKLCVQVGCISTKELAMTVER